MDFSPPEDCHLPEPCEARRARTPRRGTTFRRSASSSTIAISGHLLNDQIDLVAHLLAHQRQTDIFAVFITITDDDAAGHPGVRQHGHQFRFRTGFQAQRLSGMDQRFNHATVLVNLDRVDEEVIAVIAIRFTRAFEGGVDRAQAVLQDLREAEQRRQSAALALHAL